jgi:hypothetical protein
MLTALDDTLFHQTADVFINTPVSDHRFFDRSVYGINAPDHSLHLMTSMGVYKNNDVLDGFAMAQLERKVQYNQRYSRRWQTDYERVGVGPLEFEILEPMKKHRIRLAKSEHPVSYELEWTSVLAAHLETRHFVRHHGRIVRDHSRFDQFGCANGWIEVAGRRFDVKDWFSWRDHAWGVRPGVGGFEPNTGGLENDGGYIGIYLWFLTDTAGGFIQLQENGEGERKYLHGAIDSRTDAPQLEVIDFKHDIIFEAGTRIYKYARFHFTTADGVEWDVEVEPLGRAWVFKGSGYNHGYNDERGLGYFRGEYLEEADVYDIRHPEEVVMPDGIRIRPLHREQFAKVTVNGKPGQAHCPVITTGFHRRYGFEGGAGEMPA